MHYLRDTVACLAAAGAVAVIVWLRYFAVRRTPRK